MVRHSMFIKLVFSYCCLEDGRKYGIHVYSEDQNVEIYHFGGIKSGELKIKKYTPDVN